MTPLQTIKRLAELQKDATKGPWETGEASWNEDGEVRYTLHGNKYAKVADCQLIAQSGSTDFAAIADYVEGLRAAVREAVAVLDDMIQKDSIGDYLTTPHELACKKALAALRGLGAE